MCIRDRLLFEIIGTLKGQVIVKFSDIDKLDFLFVLLDCKKYVDFTKHFLDKAFNVLIELTTNLNSSPFKK